MPRKRTRARGRTRRTFELDAHLSRRLGAFAAYHGLRESAVVELAISAHLRGFTVSLGEAGGREGAAVAEIAA